MRIAGNLPPLREMVMGVFLMGASMLASSNGLIVGGRSAHEAFQNDGVVSLLEAMNNKDSREARRLMDSGVNINAVGKGGATPLLWMLGLHDIEAMRLLLELGANPNQYVVDGVGPPVWLAAGGGKRDALKLLLDHGGDANLPYGTRSPLMMAIGGSHLDCAELLLQHGADINYAHGSRSALSESMLHVQFADAVWVLNHGYTHDLPMARRMLAMEDPRPGQAELKAKALETVDRLLAQQKQ
jgi:ankyrin repeat protein